MTVGSLTVEVNAEGLIRFVRTTDGGELLAEERAHFWWPGSRLHTAVGHGHHRLEQRFAAYEGEKLYGLGQHQHGRLDQKGVVLDLVQRNAEVSVPVLTSSRGYTLLWNNPAIGRVELAENGTRWVADSARQIDYWIAAGTPADAQRRYSAVTVPEVESEVRRNEKTSWYEPSWLLTRPLYTPQLCPPRVALPW